jgi:hypothetical protein
VLHCRDGARCLPDVTLGIQAKELTFSSDQNLISHGQSPFLLRSGFRLATLPQRPDLVECCGDGCPSGSFSHLHRGPLICPSDHQVLGHLLTKAFLPRLLSLAVWPTLGRVLEVANFFHLRIMEALCSWGPSMLQIFFAMLSQICASTQS